MPEMAPNPFASAQAMHAAATHYGIKPALGHVALANGHRASWALGLRRTPVGLNCLMAPLVPLYDTSAMPVLGDGQEAATLNDLFDATRQDRALPKTIVANNIVAEGRVWDALTAMQASGSIGMTPLVIWERAILLRSAATDAEQYFAQNMSGSSRKRLRSKRKNLEADAPLQLRIHTTPDRINTGFDAFLTLEASGWKGQTGTALKQNPKDAAYCLDVILSLATQEQAFVATLETGNRTIAAGLFLRSEGEVTFWRTAYDETLSKESPGVIFDMILTEYFYQQPWFKVLDSASDETVDPAGLIWKQRRKMAKIVIDLEPGSWRGHAVVAGYRLRSKLKDLRNRFRQR
ncbi:MAG: GNAT family N-acetyltransferase [Beijerinckiaceae bacterium]